MYDLCRILLLDYLDQTQDASPNTPPQTKYGKWFASSSRCVKTFMWRKTLWEKKYSHMWGKLPGYLINWIPIPSQCHECFGFSKALVSTSAVCSGSWQFSILNTLSATRSQTQWWWIAIWICLDCRWNWGLWVSTTDPLLSPLITVADHCGNLSSPYKFLSHIALHPASDSTTYSASVEDSAMTLCFFDFQVIAPPAARKL